jgi:hypothetical protein
MLSAHRLRHVVAIAGAALALVIVPSASAGPLVASAADCDTQSLSQTFFPWADAANYTLNPGGAFENGGAGWLLSGASVVAGNEPFNVTSARDNNSLNVPAGASATSAPICVGIEHPDIRFFSRASNPSAALRVEVLFEDASGGVQSLQIGTVTGGIKWSPTAPFPIVANLLALMPGDHTAVAFRFSSYGGSFQIDDLYVDPYARN